MYQKMAHDFGKGTNSAQRPPKPWVSLLHTRTNLLSRSSSGSSDQTAKLNMASGSRKEKMYDMFDEPCEEIRNNGVNEGQRNKVYDSFENDNDFISDVNKADDGGLSLNRNIGQGIYDSFDVDTPFGDMPTPAASMEAQGPYQSFDSPQDGGLSLNRNIGQGIYDSFDVDTPFGDIITPAASTETQGPYQSFDSPQAKVRVINSETAAEQPSIDNVRARVPHPMAALFHGKVGSGSGSPDRSQSVGLNKVVSSLPVRAHSEGGISPSNLREWFSNSQAHRRDASDEIEKVVSDNIGDEGSRLDEEPGGNKDWNKAWQEALEMPITASKSSRWERLDKIAADFKATAENYTRVIVMERSLPDHLKTVKPLSRDSHLGIAGGQKYLVAGIYIKFLIDHKKVYGSEEHAAKIGNHELRNANLIFSGSRALLDKEGGDSSSGVGPVRVPLMVMVDFLGSRSLATSKLPISPETLVFGSDDAGENIRRDDILLPGMENKTPYELMRSISIELNLKAHLVVDQTTRRLVQIDSCADLEGHLGTDSRLYVLDTARVMPAEGPLDLVEGSEDGEMTPRWPKVKAAHLVYQLRPKVVLGNPIPLSSDAWSRFGAHDSKIHNKEVADATTYLLDVLIPQFAQSLTGKHPFRKSSKSSKTRDDDYLIPRLLHEAGINLRYMGRIYKHLHKIGSTLSVENDDEKKKLIELWQELLLVEMVSRCVKHRIRCRCLSISTAKELSADHAYRVVFISEMNKCLSKLSSAQTALWHPLHSLQRDLLERFGFFAHYEALPSCLPSHQNQRTFNSNVSGRRLFRRLVEPLGLYFLPSVYDQLANDETEAGFETKRPLDVIDLVDVRPVVKQMAIVSHARAMLHYERALKLRAADREADGSGNNTVRLLRLAAEEFRNSLRSLPDNTLERSRLANVLVQVASRTTDRDESLLNYSKAIEILKSAISICEAQKETVSYDRTNSYAIGSMVTLLEAALGTFVRWATPNPLPVLISPWSASDSTETSNNEHMSSHSDKITAMYVEPTSMTLITGGADRCVKAWRMLKHNFLFPSSTEFTNNSGHIQPLWSQRGVFEDKVLSVHANTEYVAAVSQDRRVCVYSLVDGIKVSRLELDKDYATCVRLSPTHSKNIKGEVKKNNRHFIALGTSYRKVFVYEIFVDKNKEPQLVRSLVFAHTRVISLQFANEKESTWKLPNSLNRSIQVDHIRRDLGDEEVGMHAEAPNRKPRTRRSSFGPSSPSALLAFSHHSSEQGQSIGTFSTTGYQSTIQIFDTGSTSRVTSDSANDDHTYSSPYHNQQYSNDIDQCLIMGLKDGSVLQWDWTRRRQPSKGLVTPPGLYPQLQSIQVLAVPLTGSTLLDTASLIRCTLVVKLFQVVAESFNMSVDKRHYHSPIELLSVVEKLAQEVAVMEEKQRQTSVSKVADPQSTNSRSSYSHNKNQNKISESALPGIQTFKVRLEAAMETATSEAAALSNMLAEYEQHLHHLLTFPSPSHCNKLELDLVNGQVLCATMKGLNRRPLALVKPSSIFIDKPVEQPFIHSDIDPHIPCYQLKVLPTEQVLFSIGKDRMLRVWDLKSGTAIRCLPSFSSDAPLAASNGVVVSVVGQQKESTIKAWSVWG